MSSITQICHSLRNHQVSSMLFYLLSLTFAASTQAELVVTCLMPGDLCQHFTSNIPKNLKFEIWTLEFQEETNQEHLVKLDVSRGTLLMGLSENADPFITHSLVFLNPVTEEVELLFLNKIENGLGNTVIRTTNSRVTEEKETYFVKIHGGFICQSLGAAGQKKLQDLGVRYPESPKSSSFTWFKW